MTFEQINNTTSAVTYLHHDQAGSTRLITGSTGTVEGAYTYDAYGNQTGHTGTATTPLGYVQYTSTDTGLIYLRARVYDPATAQFLTVDPVVSLTGAPYNYGEDNPLNEADPSGQCSIVPGSSENCFSEIPGAIASGAESIAKHPAEAGGIALGGVALGTGVGEVVAGGTAVTEGTLGAISAGSGAAATGLDLDACAGGSGVGCVGAGVGAIASGGAAAVVFGVATGTAAAGTTAIGLAAGGIGFLGDIAGAMASRGGINSSTASGCG